MCHGLDEGISRVDPAEPATEWPWTMPQERVGCRPVQPAWVETSINSSLTSRGQYGCAYCMERLGFGSNTPFFFLVYVPGRAPFLFFFLVEPAHQ